jgi:hypothetical protein
MAGGDRIPSITVQQRLFVDRWWGNGGNIIEAVEYAGYQGHPSPADKAKHGRRLLASRNVKKYLDYLRAQHKAEEAAKRKAAATAAAAADDGNPDLKTRPSARMGVQEKSIRWGDGIGEGGSEGVDGGSEGVDGDVDRGSGVFFLA